MRGLTLPGNDFAWHFCSQAAFAKGKGRSGKNGRELREKIASGNGKGAKVAEFAGPYPL